MNTYLSIAKFLGKIFSDFSCLLIIYFIIINLISFILYYVDKQKAKKHLWRIPEATLLLFAFIGGSFGAYAAMKIFRHKTKHPKFYISVPLFMILHILIIVTGIVGILK